jgi:hypothetical protein
VTIKPIETRYAGHRFRSRLEARWAVFFTTLGIRWEYEPQGYIVDGTPYLPDFKLTIPAHPRAKTTDVTGLWAATRIADLKITDGVPAYGSDEWLQLEAADPRKAASVIAAAEGWRDRNSRALNRIAAERDEDTLQVFAEIKNAEVDEHEGEHVDLCRALSRGTDTRVLLLTGVPTYRLYHQFTPWLEPDAFTAAFFRDYAPMLQTADGYWFDQAALNSETGVWEFPHDDRAARKSFGQGLVDAVTAARSARFEHGETP